jgi:hypothetical protein
MVSVVLQALAKMQFKPPPPFVLECAAYLQGKLEAVASGQAPITVLDVGMAARLMAALISFSFEPPPPLLGMVRAFTAFMPGGAHAQHSCTRRQGRDGGCVEWCTELIEPQGGCLQVLGGKPTNLSIRFDWLLQETFQKLLHDFLLFLNKWTTAISAGVQGDSNADGYS